MNVIINAARLAERAHRDQKRRDGSPYIVHPMRVAGMVTLWVAKQPLPMPMHENMIAAAWLHDVLEDTKLTDGDVHAALGGSVTDLVVELTNASKGSKEPRAVRKSMDRAKIAQASPEAKLIKMFDRIDNLKDLPEGDDFGAKYAHESLLLLDVVKDADVGVAEELREAASRLLACP
jgi:(p)ppGpp synthase/HD superfamily hydrolase